MVKGELLPLLKKKGELIPLVPLRERTAMERGQ
jgi:hypothetical protein